MKNNVVTLNKLKKTLGIDMGVASEIMRCINWGMIVDALNMADMAMGDVGVAYEKKKGVPSALITDASFFKQYVVMYVDIDNHSAPTLLYDVKRDEFLMMSLDQWKLKNGV